MSILTIVVIALGASFCDGHGHPSLLGGILSGAHQAVKGTIGEVASVVTSGFSSHFESSFHVQHQSGGHSHHHGPPPAPPQQMKPDNYEVIIVVEEQQTANNNKEGQRPPSIPAQGYGNPTKPNYSPPNKPVYNQQPSQPGYGQQSQSSYGQQPCPSCQIQNNQHSQPGFVQTSQPGYNNNQEYKPLAHPVTKPNEQGYDHNLNNGHPNRPQVILQPIQPGYGQASQTGYNNNPQPLPPVPQQNQQGYVQPTHNFAQASRPQMQPNQPGYNNNQQFIPQSLPLPTNTQNQQGFVQPTQSFSQTQAPSNQGLPAPTQETNFLSGYGKPIPPGYTYDENFVSLNKPNPAFSNTKPNSNSNNGIPTKFPATGYSVQPPQSQDPTNIYKPVDDSTKRDQKPVQKVTEKPTKDSLDGQPLYVPLNQADADKPFVNAPKRETQSGDDDQEFPIDIRFKDE